MACASCCKCGMAVRVALLVVLVALVVTCYLVHEYYLKSWGAERLDDYLSANTNTNITTDTNTDDKAACIRCAGVNNVYPVSQTTHPTYGGFQVMVINNGAWVTAMLMIVGVAIGGGGSLVVTLLNAMHGAAPLSRKPTSSTAQNGCGLFEMVFMVSQAQFITMLGALQLQGTPLFFLQFVKRIAWTNLQIFPREVSFDPTANTNTDVDTITTRSLLNYDNSDANATGVERYALLTGATPNHLFYYTSLVLTIALATVIVVYLVLRVLFARCKKDVAASLDHRVIWVVLQLLMLAQYTVAMTASFQIYYTLTAANQSPGDIGLAIVILALVCYGLLIFGIVKIARHQEELMTHGTMDHDDTKPFHLRFSVLYLDYTVENAYFFAAKLVLDVTSGVIVGLVQDAPLQIALLVALNGAFLVLLILRQPYLVPMFYVLMVIAGYLRIVLLMLALVQAKDDLFSQDVRDYVAVLIIVINAVLLMCVLARQFYVLSVAIFRWASRPKAPITDEELGIPLVERNNRPPAVAPGSGPNKKKKKGEKEEKTDAKAGADEDAKPEKESSEKKKKEDKNEIKDSTLFAQQPYQELKDDAKKKTGSTSSRRSLYSAKKTERKKYAPVKDEDLPDWAKV